jgi:hypothetical protein
MPESDYGWGDSDSDNSGAQPFGSSVGVAALVVASGLYGAALWVASGLQPFSYLAARAVRPARPQLSHGAETL